ncbi:cytochrome P450 2J6-like [Clavelina lepadiformis]|uniref:cytochrome P450 2J6-like n=1 Tax=Clavelina lepadiformis TaxID=159417 RepID=UPI0040412B4B
MISLTYFMISLFILFLLCYWHRRPKKFPPGPRGIPFLGVIPFVGAFPERAFAKWSKMYGPVLSVRMGREDWVILNDFQSLNQAFVKQHEAFSGRPPLPIFDQIGETVGIAFADYGPYWKTQRQFSVSVLRSLSVGDKCFEKRILEEVDSLIEAIRFENGKEFDITPTLKTATANIISSIVLGKRFDYDDDKFKQMLNRSFKYFSNNIEGLMVRIMMFAPKLMSVPPFSFVSRRMMHEFNLSFETFREIVDEHEDSFNPRHLRNYIDAFLARMKQEDNEHFTLPHLMRSILDLFLAGTETSATTLSWALLCLLHYPQAQAKLRKEIYDVIGPSGAVIMTQKPNLPYTNAFIQELFRYRSIATLGVPHKTTTDVTLNEYFIPKDTKVLSNIWAIHNDSDVWRETDQFKPERFLDANGSFVYSNQVIPFSIGPRYCLGEQLSRMEVFLFLVSMVQKFEFLPPTDDGLLPDIKKGTSSFVYAPLHFKIKAREL